jgi:Universal stress protein UspA and related nucleotide-binding proteins
MKNILAAIDFSDCSVNALEHAVSIAVKGPFAVHMVWVNNPSVTKTTIYSDTSSELIDEVKNQFEKLILKYQAEFPGIKIDYIIREGKVYREIIDEAKELESLIIVMGTHGASGFEQLWIGSNANKLISISNIPVITVRAGVNVSATLSRIILPIDSTLETRQKVPFTVMLAKLFDAEIHILALYRTQVKNVRIRIDIYVEQVVEYLEEEEVKFVSKSIDADNITMATIEYGKSIDANLISIMTEQETSPYNLLIGPYAQQMVNSSPFPVLSIKPRELMITDSR